MKHKAGHESWYRISKEKKTYEILWNSITTKKGSINIKKLENYTEDTFFKEKPYLQEYLTENNTISHNKIDYSMFYQRPGNCINNSSLYECFHGILFYIYYYSNNKFNIEELEFHFSGGNKFSNDEIIKNPDKSNILNIFNYKCVSDQFTIKRTKNAFFGITFKKIYIIPIAYSIRSGINTATSSHLISFTFEGYDDENKKWDTLDERMNINDLICNGSYKLFYVSSTKKSYSSFKIRQTDKGNNGLWGFSISAFDIHGIISLRQKSFYHSDNFLSTDEHISINSSNDFNYDPIMDMTKYIY